MNVHAPDIERDPTEAEAQAALAKKQQEAVGLKETVQQSCVAMQV